jgi:ankyrin repeat protein
MRRRARVNIIPRFRWVACQLDHLCSLTSDRDRRLALRTLPPTLASTYDRILERLNKKSESACRLVDRVLKWLTEPEQDWDRRSVIHMPRISVPELCVAISIEEDDAAIDLYGVPSLDEILVHSSSLLRLSQDGKYVEFAHFTVEEYLRSIDPRERTDLARYRWDELKATTYQLETSLTFLTMDNFHPSLCGNVETVQQLLETHRFYFRASVLWASYVTQGRSSGRAAKSMEKLLDPHSNTSVFDNWLQIRLLATRLYGDWILDPVDYGRPVLDTEYRILAENFARTLTIAAGTSQLHIAAMFTLVDLIPQSFRTRSQINSISAFGTPLHCALTGYDAIAIATGMEWPFRRKPDVDGTRLSSTIALLVDLGADLGAHFHTRSMIFTPLFLATWCSKTEQLLEAGAVLDQTTVRAIMDNSPAYGNFNLAPFAQTSLESISENDRPCVARFLLTIAPGRQLIAPNPTAFRHTTLAELEATLRDTCRNNQLPIFRWVLEGSDIDINYEFRGEGETLLHVACSRFASEIVKYLVGKGADVNKRDHHVHSCLWHYFDAARWRDDAGNTNRFFRDQAPFSQQSCLATLGIILDGKAQLHTLLEDHKSVLMLWAECRSNELESLEGALRLLLNEGAQLGLRSLLGDTLWHRLAIEDHVEHSRMLKRCVDPVVFRSMIEVADNEGFTPVLKAIQVGSTKMFNFFLEQGCDPTSTTHEGHSGLYWAAANILDNNKIFRSLLSNFLHTGDSVSSFDGSTLAHACVRSIAYPHGSKNSWRMALRFKESIEDLVASSISITDTNLEGETPLDQLCRWIATEGHHNCFGCFHCEGCFGSFEALVALEHQNYDQLQADVTWTTTLLRGLEAQAHSSEDLALEYPVDTVCSLAVCAAIDRGIPPEKLSAELDLDSIFEIAAMLGQESLIL